jgi:hypothetical protein
VRSITKRFALACPASTKGNKLLARGNGKRISKVIDNFDGHGQNEWTVFPTANTHQNSP